MTVHQYPASIAQFAGNRPALHEPACFQKEIEAHVVREVIVRSFMNRCVAEGSAEENICLLLSVSSVDFDFYDIIIMV